MADSFSVDFSEVNKFIADLGDVPLKLVPNVRKAVEVTARNVKDDWRKGAKRSGLKKYAASIDYDMKLDTDGSIGAEIGPNLGRVQGTFGFVEDAPGGVRSTPQYAGRKAAKANEADFISGLTKAIGDADA